MATDRRARPRMALPWPLLLLLGAFALGIKPAIASYGDNSPPFRACLAACLSRCSPSPDAVTTSSPALVLTHWTCSDECKYDCMTELTEGQLQHQFYGKWPFTRMLGMQEPASVTFSVANGLMHWRGIQAFRRRIAPGNPLRALYLAWGVAGVNTWIWSTIFHVRDKPWTERMDYFSAALGITYSLFLAIVRIWHLYSKAGRTKYSAAYKRLAALMATIYVCHVVYLSSLERFDYAYNIVFNAAIGITHNLLWMLWSLTSSVSPTRLVAKLLPMPYPVPTTFSAHLSHVQQRSQTHTRLPALVGLLFMLAMCFELFDFPPLLRTFDAHSLWHLATVFIVPLWWRFLAADAACFNSGSDSARP